MEVLAAGVLLSGTMPSCNSPCTNPHEPHQDHLRPFPATLEDLLPLVCEGRSVPVGSCTAAAVSHCHEYPLGVRLSDIKTFMGV